LSVRDKYPEWLSSAKLLRDFNIEITLENLSPLRVGSGREATLGSPVDMAVMRINYNGVPTPYIPGSSIKGIFRSIAISIARSKGLEVCEGIPKDNCLENKRDGEKTLMQEIDEIIKMCGSREAMKVFAEKACLICKVFGSPHYASKITFTDAYPTNPEKPPLTGLKTGIAINRRTGAVHGGALFIVEYIEPGAKFIFSILSRNLPNYALGLISSVLLMVRDGLVRLGGFKTRGFGIVGVKDIKISVRDYEGGKLLRGLDELDSDVQLEKVQGSAAVIGGETVWALLEKLAEVWDSYAEQIGKRG